MSQPNRPEAPTEEHAEAPSRRAANKARTRRSIVEASLDLFSERGYDDATVEDIARRAGISPRTFFRYFESKERVLFFGREDFFELLLITFGHGPAGEADLELLTRTIVDLAPRLEPLADRIRRYSLAVASSVALRGRDRDERFRAAASVSEAIARRHGRDVANADDDLLGDLIVLLVGRAIERWMAAGGAQPLAPFFLEERRRLNDVVAGR